MQTIKLEDKRLKLILSEGEYEELLEALADAAKGRRVDAQSTTGKCGRFEIKINLCRRSKMRAVLCPVCKGGVVIPANVCDNYQQEIYHIEPHQEDRCPACGGDSNSPPLTGCPMGSHYGTYSDYG